MFGWFSSAGKKAPSVRARSARLSVEQLESRDTPSTLTLSVSYGVANNVTLWGNLTNTTNPANQLIMISGQAAAMVSTDENGHFCVIVSANGLGEIDAQTQDGLSNVASVTLVDTAPQITSFVAVEDEGNVWEFKGTVTWIRGFESMPVLLQGPPSVGNYQTTAQSDGTVSNGVSTGTFDVCIQLSGQSYDNGSVIATATDCWGLASNEAYASIYQTSTNGGSGTSSM